MYYFILFITAILPSLVILRVVYSKDNSKEPHKLLLALFGVGIISCFLTLVLSNVLGIIFPFFDTEASTVYKDNYFYLFIYCFIGIGLIEEWSKWIFNYGIIWNHKEFDHVYDAIVYAVFVSLGFATFENTLYVMTGGFRTAILRALLSVPAHAYFAISMGYYIGMAKQSLFNGNNKLSKKYQFMSILIPVLLHGFYDFCLFSRNLILIFLLFVFVIIICFKSIKRLNHFSSIRENIITK